MLLKQQKSPFSVLWTRTCAVKNTLNIFRWCNREDPAGESAVSGVIAEMMYGNRRQHNTNKLYYNHQPALIYVERQLQKYSNIYHFDQCKRVFLDECSWYAIVSFSTWIECYRGEGGKKKIYNIKVHEFQSSQHWVMILKCYRRVALKPGGIELQPIIVA